MVAVASTMLALGTAAPDFSLLDVVSGKTVSPAVADGKKGLLVMFVSRHCPYVQHVKEELARLGRDYSGQVGIVAISANDVVGYPDDSPANLKRMALETEFNFPVCYDESQQVAKAYSAACTPDFFLFDSKRRLVYRGQLDESRPGNGKPITGSDLRAAIDCLVTGKPVNENQKPSLGCNIKWRSGNAPDYFRR